MIFTRANPNIFAGNGLCQVLQTLYLVDIVYMGFMNNKKHNIKICGSSYTRQRRCWNICVFFIQNETDCIFFYFELKSMLNLYRSDFWKVVIRYGLALLKDNTLEVAKQKRPWSFSSSTSPTNIYWGELYENWYTLEVAKQKGPLKFKLKLQIVHKYADILSMKSSHS